MGTILIASLLVSADAELWHAAYLVLSHPVHNIINVDNEDITQYCHSTVPP